MYDNLSDSSFLLIYSFKNFIDFHALPIILSIGCIDQSSMTCFKRDKFSILQLNLQNRIKDGFIVDMPRLLLSGFLPNTASAQVPGM